LARAEHPDVITLDVLMPTLDGWGVLAALKSDPTVASIPVVMLTISDEQTLGFSLGAAEYLTKPIERARLREVLQRYRPRGDAGVLIVEDDESVRTVLRRTLEKEGWRVSEAENGRVGLERLDTDQPALVLLDLMMPDVDGFGFLDGLRARQLEHPPAVVVITAKELTDDDRRRLNGAVRDVIEKGAQRIERLLDDVRRSAAAHRRAAAQDATS
jgi:CheY-like chemotaxis protein